MKTQDTTKGAIPCQATTDHTAQPNANRESLPHQENPEEAPPKQKEPQEEGQEDDRLEDLPCLQNTR